MMKKLRSLPAQCFAFLSITMLFLALQASTLWAAACDASQTTTYPKVAISNGAVHAASSLNTTADWIDIFACNACLIESHTESAMNLDVMNSWNVNLFRS